MNLEARIQEIGVVPVVTVSGAEQAIPVVEALVAGGLPCVEITFRSDAAPAAIEAVRARLPAVLVAAGTVLTALQARAAITAGAELIVAPGFNPAVVDECQARGIAVMPGVATPSEIEQALSRELRLLKFFPAGPLGGVAYLKALAGPYPMIRFVPTGGVTPGNLADYLALSNVAACGGTWLARADVLAVGDFAAVERLAREASSIVARVRSATLDGMAVAGGRP